MRWYPGRTQYESNRSRSDGKMRNESERVEDACAVSQDGEIRMVEKIKMLKNTKRLLCSRLYSFSEWASRRTA